MTALVNISSDNVLAIREGLNGLGNALLSINAIVGDDTSSRLIIDGGGTLKVQGNTDTIFDCLLYTSPSPRDGLLSRMPSSA